MVDGSSGENNGNASSPPSRLSQQDEQRMRKAFQDIRTLMTPPQSLFHANHQVGKLSFEDNTYPRVKLALDRIGKSLEDKPTEKESLSLKRAFKGIRNIMHEKPMEKSVMLENVAKGVGVGIQELPAAFESFHDALTFLAASNVEIAFHPAPPSNNGTGLVRPTFEPSKTNVRVGMKMDENSTAQSESLQQFGRDMKLISNDAALRARELTAPTTISSEILDRLQERGEAVYQARQPAKIQRGAKQPDVSTKSTDPRPAQAEHGTVSSSSKPVVER